MQAEESILFYGHHNQYGQFSNFYAAPFSENGKMYKTSEHYFQSKKFEGKQFELMVIQSKSPFDAAKLGRNKNFPLREDWQAVKETIMMKALQLKFGTHPKLKELLLSTGNKTLIEHTNNDNYWGDGGDGKGKNRLGILLMELRQKLRNAQIKQ